MRNLARGAFFLSGIAGLLFEIVWVRHLGLALGTTTLAVATTTAAYMGGMALGSHVGGRIADRLRRPLAAYGAVEFAVGLFGLLVPVLCMQLPNVDAALFSGVQDGFTRSMLRFVLAFCVLALPTIAMGATLPILARAVTDRIDSVGREVGLLYALNIAGALLGAGIAGFVAIPTLGLAMTNRMAVGIDLLLGTVAFLVGQRVQPLPPVTETAGEVPAVWRPGGRYLVGLLGVTGAAAMSLQVLWTRALGTALGPSTYAFSAIVCAYLAGLAIGSTVASRIADRVTVVRFALMVVLMTTGLCALSGILWVDDLPQLLHPIVLDKTLTMGGLVRSEFFLAALSVLPATVAMGAIFPLTLSAVVGSQEHVGRAVGRAYAINTMGSIVGSFAAVFVLLPLFGVEGGMRAATLCYVGGALYLSGRLEPSVHRIVRYGGAALALALGAAIIAWPSWDVGAWTSGLYRLSMTRAYYPEGQDFTPSKLVFHEDGLASTVTVENDEGVRWIKVNGKIDGSSEGDMPTQVLSGLLPMLVHPSPDEVAVIGCGSCVTVGAALQGGPKHVTLVELEKQVVAAAHLFEDVNHAPWNDSRVNIVEDDGRNFLSRADAPFDVIVSEPSNPWMTGAASLFTQEFFARAKNRLKPDGMFVQWLQIYELAPERINSVLKTFHSVFPSVLVFSAHPDSNDLLMIGSPTPVRLSWERMNSRFTLAKEELERADLQTPADLMALMLFTDKELDTLPADTQLNTDDNALIEFGAPQDLVAFAEDDPDLPLLHAAAGVRPRMLKGVLDAQSPWPMVLADVSEGYLRQGMMEDATAAAEEVMNASPEASREAADRAKEIFDLALLFTEPDRERVVDVDTVDDEEDFSRAAHLFLDGDNQKALEYLEARPSLVRRNPDYTMFYGYLLYRNEQYEAAERTLMRGRRMGPDSDLVPAATYYLARTQYYNGEYKRAVQEMQQYRQSTAEPLSDANAEE